MSLYIDFFLQMITRVEFFRWRVWYRHPNNKCIHRKYPWNSVRFLFSNVNNCTFDQQNVIFFFCSTVMRKDRCGKIWRKKYWVYNHLYIYIYIYFNLPIVYIIYIKDASPFKVTILKRLFMMRKLNIFKVKITIYLKLQLLLYEIGIG